MKQVHVLRDNYWTNHNLSVIFLVKTPAVVLIWALSMLHPHNRFYLTPHKLSHYFGLIDFTEKPAFLRMFLITGTSGRSRRLTRRFEHNSSFGDCIQAELPAYRRWGDVARYAGREARRYCRSPGNPYSHYSGNRQEEANGDTERAVRQSRKLANTCRLLNVLSIESEGYLSGGDLK